MSTAHNHRSNYVMSNGDFRRSHSASFFKVTSRTEEDINQRLREDYVKKTILHQHFLFMLHLQ